MRMVRRRGRTNRPAQLQHRSSRQIGCRTPSSAMCTSRMLETFAGRSRIGVVERVRASSSRVRLDAGRHGCCLSACATITAHRERDAPGSARTRLRGLAHLPDSLGPQIDLHLHPIWRLDRRPHGSRGALLTDAMGPPGEASGFVATECVRNPVNGAFYRPVRPS